MTLADSARIGVAGALNLRVRCYQLGNGEANPAMLINVGFFT